MNLTDFQDKIEEAMELLKEKKPDLMGYGPYGPLVDVQRTWMGGIRIHLSDGSYIEGNDIKLFPGCISVRWTVSHLLFHSGDIPLYRINSNVHPKEDPFNVFLLVDRIEVPNI